MIHDDDSWFMVDDPFFGVGWGESWHDDDDDDDDDDEDDSYFGGGGCCFFWSWQMICHPRSGIGMFFSS